MRPFLPISLPVLPTFAEYSCLIPSASVETPSDLLDEAELALKRARKEWEAVSKVGPETGRFVGCEEGWRKGVKDVLRGCIAGSIAVGAVRRAAGEGEGKVRVEVPAVGGRYHAWWVVPKVVPVK